jgi:hypothetical protein
MLAYLQDQITNFMGSADLHDDLTIVVVKL